MLATLLISLLFLAPATETRPELAPPWPYVAAMARVELWLERYPELVTKRVIGASAEGRELVVLRIGRAPAPGVPELYLGSGIHGQESSQTDALWLIEHLLARAAEPRIAALLAKRVLWFQPLVNPDGVAKRQRLNASGVDLNRNFSHLWTDYGERGAYGYAGPAPFSEPETIALRDFLRGREQLRAYLDLHRSTSLILTPNIGRGAAKAEPLVATAAALGAAMGDPYDSAKLPRSVFHDQGGFSVDWVWAELGVVAFTWELPYGNDASGFSDDHRWRGFLHLLEACGSYPRETRKLVRTVPSSPGFALSTD